MHVCALVRASGAVVVSRHRPRVAAAVRRGAFARSSAQALALFLAFPRQASSQDMCAPGAATPTTMKAVTRATARGFDWPAGDFAFERGRAVPAVASPSEVLVAVRAAAINPVDYKVSDRVIFTCPSILH